MVKAFIDLGTNTFQLLIVDSHRQPLYKDSIATKLGKGGINQNIILPEAIERAVNALKIFRAKATEWGVSDEAIYAIGTSAIRNAENKEEFLAIVKAETGLTITVIDGEKEAFYIYEGVKQAVNLKSNSLIIDIGGGSVEFIITNEHEILWKQSFEIGGLRLMELFMKSDPISQKSIRQMDDYFREKLLPLTNACHQYHPALLVGSSGSFDTLIDIHFMRMYNRLPSSKEIGFDLPMSSFYESYEAIVFNNRAERMNIPGMIELRVDMIVVALCLIRFVLQAYSIQQLAVSSYSLKEGVMRYLSEGNKKG